jgi:SAM-dependent methyltransferase
VTRAYVQGKLDFIWRHIPRTAVASVLDVGCGNGIFTSALADSTEPVGVDYSLNMLSANPASRRVCGLATELPFASNMFDLVFTANLLHHVEDPAKVIIEMRRVSRQFVAFVEPNRWNPLMWVFGAIYPPERGTLRSSAGILMQAARSAGLDVIACECMGMISQNNTPAFLLPLLQKVDGVQPLGEYAVLVARKRVAGESQWHSSP